MNQAVASGSPLLGGFKTSYLAGLGAPILVLMVLVMLVLPLPPIALDLFFTFNIALALVVLLSCIYANRPLEFSVFPTVLLVTTLLRLSLNVASTRVVLLEGQAGSGAAGSVIEAFGEFVIGGNYAVGIVVFAILVIINFVVVTKGAGRVSEVTARFTLDAMPGKQMAIDADLNAGLITQDEALRRREDVGSEADFYGAMDGASKFVRGDAIAGILILFINILGGIAIGTLQHSLSFGQAAENYVLLTIGDGLAAQIPSLLLSTATAIIITRVSDTQDMGQQVMSQMLSNPRVLLMVAGLIGVVGVIPGMPNLVFLPLAAVIGCIGYMRMHQPEETEVEETEAPEETNTETKDISWDDVTPVDQVGLEVGYKIISLVDKNQGGILLSRIKGVRKKLSQELGFLLHPVHVRDNLELSPNSYRISFHDVTMGEGEVYPGKELAINPGQVFGQLEGIKTTDPTFGLEALWIESGERDEAQALGYTVVDCSTVIATHLSQLFKNNAADLIGQDEVQSLLDILAKASPKLVESLVPDLLSLATVSKVMQNLLAEGVPLRDIRTIAEALTATAPNSQDPDVLTAQVRVRLGKTIYQIINGLEKEIEVMVLDSNLERTLQNVVKGSAGGVEPTLMQLIVDQSMAVAQSFEAKGKVPVLLVAQDIRLFLSRLLRGRSSVLHVLAYEEVPSDKQIRVEAKVGQQNIDTQE